MDNEIILEDCRKRYKKVLAWYNEGLWNLSHETEKRELIKKINTSFRVYKSENDELIKSDNVFLLQDFLRCKYNFLSEEDIERVVPTILNEGGYQFIRFREVIVDGVGEKVYSNFLCSEFNSGDLWAAHSVIMRIILLEEEIENNIGIDKQTLEVGRVYPWARQLEPSITFQKDKKLQSAHPFIFNGRSNTELLWIYQMLFEIKVIDFQKDFFFSLFLKKGKTIRPPKKKSCKPTMADTYQRRLRSLSN